MLKEKWEMGKKLDARERQRRISEGLKASWAKRKNKIKPIVFKSCSTTITNNTIINES